MDGGFPKWANLVLLAASLIIAFHFLKESGIG